MDILKTTCVPKTNGKKVDNDVLELHAEYYGNQKASVNAPHSEMVKFVLGPAQTGIDMRKEMGKVPPYSLEKGIEYGSSMEVAKNLEMKQPSILSKVAKGPSSEQHYVG